MIKRIQSILAVGDHSLTLIDKLQIVFSKKIYAEFSDHYFS